ncbi:four helix bundle protein [Leptospira perolatii]|uniref:Four helix bundle protein n=1 Tax=Leptospira perolatii TaxID=2023191 RepID=A0A2M9ZNR5_9LEPT|nr:thioesterase family protein [Leptospira perolatii]PJZ69658.1 four helix bundle protein [Leptospira perolatii]PJZ73645.1 four helix bundle protein [Leptospira perolatii]
MKIKSKSGNPEIDFPALTYFSTEIPIRRIDLSMDLHVSFASVLDLVMEAHLQFFQYLGYSVLDIHGMSIIFANASILYQGELVYKDKVIIDVSLNKLGQKSFDLYFRLSKNKRSIKVALVKIRVLFFDYKTRAVVPIPKEFKEKFIYKKIKPQRTIPIGNAESRKTDFVQKSWGPEIGFQKLEVWRLSHSFVLDLHRTSELWKQRVDHSILTHLHKVGSLLPIRIAGAWASRARSERIRNILKAKVHLEEIRYILVLISDLGASDPSVLLEDLTKINAHLKEYLGRIRSGKVRSI